MQIVRTGAWAVILVLLALFSIENWTDTTIKIWDGMVLDTKLPALVVLAFLAGLLPMWLMAKAGRWRLKRRIASLENAVRAATPTPPLAPHAEPTHPETPFAEGKHAP